jgi:peptidoglycan/LPS O-acetylase OafA/YrhL
VPAILLAWGVIVAAASFPLVDANPELNVIANPLTIEFIAGCFVALTVQRGYVRHGGWVLITGIALLAIGGMRLTDLNSPWQRVALYGVPSALIVFGAVAIERTGKTSPRWLIAAGDASYSMYLSQGLVLATLARWAWEKKHIPTGHLINPLVAIAMAALAVVAAFACHRWVEMPLIGVTKKWLDSGRLGNGTRRAETPLLPDKGTTSSPISGPAPYPSRRGSRALSPHHRPAVGR